MSLKLSTPLTTVDSSAQFDVGSTTDQKTKEYIYLQGGTSVAANDLVTYDSNYLSTRAVAGSRGPCAVALGAYTQGKYGWCQIKGTGNVNANGAVAAGKQLFLTTGSGAVDDTIVGGDLVIGLFSGVTGTAGAGVSDCYLNYPYAGSLSAG